MLTCAVASLNAWVTYEHILRGAGLLNTHLRSISYEVDGLITA